MLTGWPPFYDKNVKRMCDYILRVRHFAVAVATVAIAIATTLLTMLRRLLASACVNRASCSSRRR
jgi:hypothetical protein